MKAISETLLVTVVTLLWLIVLPLAGLFEIVVVLSDRIEALITHQVEMASS
jgi:hypothetical protein